MPQSSMNSASLLAETIASELHALAQPLTATQWHLEIASLPGTPSERKENEVAEAFAALEGVIAHLDFLRDIIRPFRARTQFQPEVLQQALQNAILMQKEALDQEGTQVIVCEACAQSAIMAPDGFLQSILFKLLDFVRTVAPHSVRFEIGESDQTVRLVALLHSPGKRVEPAQLERVLSTLRSYVEVLAGEFSVSRDFNSLECSFRKWLA